jgi:hypothetical protein
MTVTSVSRALNDGGGQLQATGSLTGKIDLRAILNPQKTAVWLWRRVSQLNPDGSIYWSQEAPIWGGIVWKIEQDITAETATISAEGFLSYLSRVRLLSDQTFTNVDQLDIARALLDYAQGRANSLLSYGWMNSAHTVADTGGSDLGIQYDQEESGRLRVRAPADGYQASQTPVIMDLLSNLAGVIDGFQWYEDIQWAGPGVMPTPFVEFGYPQFSRALPVRLEFPGNIVSYTAPVDGSAAVNRYIAIGATNDTTSQTLIAIRNNITAQTTAGYPILMGDSGSNYTDVTNASTLDAHAAEDLATVAGNSIVYQVITRGDVFGRFGVGDTMSCHFESVWDRVPVDVQLQCIQWTLQTAATTQDEILTVDMAPVRII